ncbi:MAG: DUF4405 domain-containing protein [Proteobacteria bacterium]|nr:DUF4405 domain-containing protein [Pseudomonadota bacterium]MBU1686569.1 DUF4405 domain-containing protein [Pseudomonadota bacterium]
MKWFLNYHWGAKSLVSLYLSIVSGVILAFQYDYIEPYYSSGTLELITPYGSFWRSLHFYSSQAFFLFFLIHLVVVVIDREISLSGEGGRGSNPAEGAWLRLALSLPVAVLLLFSGYILRADATGESAGHIAENIILAVPVLGDWLNYLLFRISEVGLRVVYVNHLAGFILFWGYLCWNHLRKYRVSLKDHLLFTGIVLAVSAILTAPLEPFQPGAFQINGPWFFIGLQELLRHLQPLPAGILFPSLGMIALVGCIYRERDSLMSGFVLISWVFLYVGLSVVGFLR